MEEEKNPVSIFEIISRTIGVELSSVKAMTDEESAEWHKHHSRTNEDGSITISDDIIN